MTRLLGKAAAVIAGLCLLAQTASALTIYLGSSGVEGSETAERTKLNQLIADYNAANNPDLLLATTFSRNNEIGKDELKSGIIETEGWSYLALKYGTTVDYWYVGGNSTFSFGPFDNALSHYTLFGPIPDIPSTPEAGSTILLLASALAALGLFRNRFGMR